MSTLSTPQGPRTTNTPFKRIHEWLDITEGFTFKDAQVQVVVGAPALDSAVCWACGEGSSPALVEQRGQILVLWCMVCFHDSVLPKGPSLRPQPPLRPSPTETS